MMRESFLKAMSNASNVSPTEEVHFYHCAELVRQALNCAADSTLDSTTPRPGVPSQRATNGWGASHLCKDYDSLFRWAEKHRFSDLRGAGIEAGEHS